MKEGSIILAYLKEKRARNMLWVIMGAVLALVFYLYGIDREAIRYAIILMVTMCVIACFFEYYGYHKQYLQRLRLREAVKYNLDDMDEPKTKMEADYRTCILQLITEYENEIENRRASYQELKDYIMMWAHQIKTPITAMNLLIQTGEQKFAEQEEVYRQYRYMREKLFDIETYVGMNLEYIRLDSLNADLLVEECDLDKIVRKEVKSFSQILIMKKLHLNIEDTEYTVVSDEKWLSFVIGQVLSNSVKYTKEGGLYIHAKKEKTTTSLWIEDTGIGIGKTDLPRIFEKSFTGYNGHIEKKASGIGLYLSKRILNRLGHDIEIISEEGNGTKVCIRFFEGIGKSVM